VGLSAPDAVDPVLVARSYLDSFASGDPDRVAAWVTDDFVNEHTAALGSGCAGKVEYRRRLPGFLSSMPGLRYEVEDIFADGPKVAAAYTLHTVVNDRPIAVRGLFRFLVRDGLIAHRVDYWDSLVFQRQAGMV
jgi:ketosteroid isomerase-like protein